MNSVIFLLSSGEILSGNFTTGFNSESKVELLDHALKKNMASREDSIYSIRYNYI